jgi:aryl-alcohol dehydrogenase-like predicted oxidoreductase
MSLPVNQRRAEIVAALAALAAEAGVSLPHLALAFVRAHPAITSVLLGPRTPGQPDDLLSAAEVTLPGDVLDRIDELVPPGTGVNPADNYQADPPAIRRKELRRR